MLIVPGGAEHERNDLYDGRRMFSSCRVRSSQAVCGESTGVCRVEAQHHLPRTIRHSRQVPSQMKSIPQREANHEDHPQACSLLFVVGSDKAAAFIILRGTLTGLILRGTPTGLLSHDPGHDLSKSCDYETGLITRLMPTWSRVDLTGRYRDEVDALKNALDQAGQGEPQPVLVYEIFISEFVPWQWMQKKMRLAKAQRLLAW